MRLEGLTEKDVTRIMDQNLVSLNQNLPAYSKISQYKVMEAEFEKTPKRSIKRFLYQPDKML